MDGQEINNDKDTLFEGEGTISEDDLLELAVELEVDYHLPALSRFREVFGEMGTSLTKNLFSIGNPVPLSLETFQAVSGQSLLSNIRPQMKDHEFCPIQLTCSFVPTKGYRFHDARFEVALHTLPANASSPTVQEQTMAYSLFPLRAEDKIDHTTKVGGPVEVNFGGNPSLPGFNVSVYEKDSTFVSFTSYIEAFGLQGILPGWQFTRTQSREISGVHTLLLLVRKPKGTRVQATFSLTAHLQFMHGSTPLKTLLSLVMVFRRRNSSATITDPMVLLC